MKKRFLLLFIAILAIFTLSACGKSNAKSDGSFEIEVVDELEKQLFKETISYKNGDSLVEILKAHEKVALKGTEGQYGLYVEEVCGKKTTDAGETYFWSLYIDDEASMVGISSVELKNGLKVKLALIDWTK